MTQRVRQARPEKGMTRRRHVSQAAARRAARLAVQKADRKQAIRQVGRRRGGR
jgi:hypothetical protein